MDNALGIDDWISTKRDFAMESSFFIACSNVADATASDLFMADPLKFQTDQRLTTENFTLQQKKRKPN